MRKSGCKTCCVIAVLLALAAVGLAIIALRIVVPNQWPQDLTFDQQVWKANKNWDYDNPRGRMLDSLLSHDRLKGMTRAEVIALLGPPDGADHRIRDDLTVSEEDAAAAAELVYVLGSWSGFRMDPDFLSIRLQSEGDRVVGWTVWQS